MNAEHAALRDRTYDPGTFPPLRPPAWTEDAACITIGPDLFFPRGPNDSVTTVQAICGTCPVTTECLTWGLQIDRDNSGYRFGIYGGLTATERQDRYPLRDPDQEAAA